MKCKMVGDASRRNRALGITAVLYCLQVLEGDEKPVIMLYADILEDNRHDDVHTAAIRPVEKRDFPNRN